MEHAPPLPVSDHPDEFWDFVKRNNRVRILGVALPEESYYPLFSAYRDKTVLDIVGHRTRLPPPALDRPGAHVDLADIQGNLLENYHARFARHFILTVVDPPRAGLSNKAIRRLGRIGARRIVYVSCNPTTLAGNVKLLRHDWGYELKQTRPVDMFPHTPHVESVSLLERTAVSDTFE